MLDNYAEETTPLFKMLRTEAFRFVIVRYNHFSFIPQLEQDLQRLFPDRPFLKIDARKADYQSLTQSYFSIHSGFVFIENFDEILKEQFDSQNKETPAYKIDNARKRGITAGLNLRRDKLAKYPIALFVFVPATAGELYARVIMEKMPDLWSFRSLILDLEKEREVTISPKNTFQETSQNLRALDTDSTELNRLLNLLEKTPETEKAYRLTLYPQITEEATNTGKYELSFSILEEWEKQANEEDKAEIWRKKGYIFSVLGQLEQAMAEFEKARIISKKLKDNNELALAYERLGNTLTVLGNLDKALAYFENYNRLEKKLYNANPNNITYKNNWAISYSKLGDTHSSLGNLDKALGFFEKDIELSKELYADYPNNVDFKNGLAISYSRLGNTHSRLGNLEKALGFFEKDIELSKELYDDYPNNVNFKNNLAISYSKLGDTHSNLGNLDKALGFFEEYNRLEKELYDDYPNNVNFKNGLAVSYAKLGEFSQEKLSDKTKAKGYFKQAEGLWLDLVRDAPQYVQFQEFLGIVQEVLKDL